METEIRAVTFYVEENEVCPGCGQEVVLPGWAEVHHPCECDHPEIGPHFWCGNILWHRNTSPRPRAVGHEWVGILTTHNGYACGKQISVIPAAGFTASFSEDGSYIQILGNKATLESLTNGELASASLHHLCTIRQAALDFGVKRIGFGEFKRIVRENS